jgi:hypothetical protein
LRFLRTIGDLLAAPLGMDPDDYRREVARLMLRRARANGTATVTLPRP